MINDSLGQIFYKRKKPHPSYSEAKSRVSIVISAYLGLTNFCSDWGKLTGNSTAGVAGRFLRCITR